MRRRGTTSTLSGIRARALAAAFALLCAGGAVPAAAWAFVLEREPGGPRVVTYHVAAGQHRWAIEQALGAWGGSGARIELVEVPAEEAAMTFAYRPGPPALEGETALAFEDRGTGEHLTAAEVRLPRFADAQAARRERFAVAVIAAHEVGHVLGLGHEDSGCALMNSLLEEDVPVQCPQPPPGSWRCGLVEPDDVAGVIELYGGRPRPPRRRTCPIAPAGPPAAPSAVTVRLERSGPGHHIVRWTSAPDRGLRRVVIARSRSRCPTSPEEPGVRSVPTRPERRGSARLPLALGRWCYALWSQDRRGRLSAAPAVAWTTASRGPLPPERVEARAPWPFPLVGLARLSWRNPDDATLRRVTITAAPKGCRRARLSIRLRARPRAEQSFVDLSFPAGSRPCYRLRTTDAAGGRSPAAVVRPRAPDAGQRETTASSSSANLPFAVSVRSSG